MHILHLNFERGWRGGERQTLLCLQQLRLQGHDVQLLARKGEPLARAAHDEGFTVHAAQGVAGACLSLLCIGQRFDILHAQTANTLSWLAVMKTFLGKPVVFTRRTAFQVSSSRQARTRMKWRRADAFVAISEAAAAQPRRLGLPVSVIRSAVEPVQPDTARMRQLSEKFALDGKWVVGTSAALTREKDPLTLMRAIHQLRKTHPQIVCLHFGADGDVADAARQLAKELDLSSHYIFAGFEPAVEKVYGLFNVFVQSSVEEALGSSVLDAFSQGVPVVSTRAGGLKESLADGRGLLCNAGDFRLMAEHIAQALENEPLRAEMTEKARLYVQQIHNVTVMGQRYLAVYQSLLKQ